MGYMKNGWQANVTGCCLPTSALNYTLHVSHHMIRLVSILILKIINPFLFLPFPSLPFHSFPSFPFPLFPFPSPPSLLSLSPPLLCHSLHPSAIRWPLWQRGLHHDALSHSFFPSLQIVKKELFIHCEEINTWRENSGFQAVSPGIQTSRKKRAFPLWCFLFLWFKTSPAIVEWRYFKQSLLDIGCFHT